MQLLLVLVVVVVSLKEGVVIAQCSNGQPPAAKCFSFGANQFCGGTEYNCEKGMCCKRAITTGVTTNQVTNNQVQPMYYLLQPMQQMQPTAVKAASCPFNQQPVCPCNNSPTQATCPQMTYCTQNRAPTTTNANDASVCCPMPYYQQNKAAYTSKNTAIRYVQQPNTNVNQFAQAIRNQVDRYRPVLMYTLSGCKYCTLAKKLLAVNYPEYKVYFLDVDALLGDALFRDAISNVTNTTQVPQIFICGRYVGGYSELMTIHASGQLGLTMEKCKQK